MRRNCQKQEFTIKKKLYQVKDNICSFIKQAFLGKRTVRQKTARLTLTRQRFLMLCCTSLLDLHRHFIPAVLRNQQSFS